MEREDLERVRREIEARYRMELNRKLEDVNNYLEEQARARDKLDVSRDETEFKIRDDHKKIQVWIFVLFAQLQTSKLKNYCTTTNFKVKSLIVLVQIKLVLP